MKMSAWFVVGGVLLVASCAETGTGTGTTSQTHFGTLPEGVLAIAAPYQDLTAVRIDPEDGCYVYRHAGPVETTYLPLRTVEGRPICSRATEA